MKCPKCQFDNPEGAKFCNECGHKFGEEPAIEGERKQVTVLFSDLSGYTAMSEKLDPEEVKNIISRIFGEIAQVVVKYDGSIEKFIGDAVVAFFGVPKAHEDDPVRALRAAREIHEIVNAMSHQFESKVGMALSMHTGINTGLVVTGEVTDGKGPLGVTGDTVNVASRLSGLARPGEILVGEDTYRQAEGLFNIRPLEPVNVKGKTEPIRVYKVLSLREEPAKTHRLSGMRADLIGRKSQIALLSEAVYKLREGKELIFSICGDAGTGKSRLIEEFKATLDIRNIQWWEGHAYAYSQNIPYSLLVNLLNRAWQIGESDSSEKVREKMESGINYLMERRAEFTPYIGGLYSLNYPELEGISHELWKIRLQEAVQVLFEAFARKAPAVICLEDLHWADPSSVELVHVILSKFKYPALFLCVYRPTFSLFSNYTLNETEKLCQEIHLRDFSSSESYEMLQSLLKTRIIPVELKKFIEEKGEGNPFYLEEVINSLIESGTLARDNGYWKLTRPITESRIPSTIQGVITGRIDRLENETKRVLQESSCLGRTFPYEILKRITGLQGHVNQCLSDLERLDLIRTKTPLPELEYIFKHALTQEVVYSSLLKKDREAIHKRIALAMEQLFRDRLPEFYETLAFHFTRGQSFDKAVDYLKRAGEKSFYRYALMESHQYLKEAFEILSTKPRKSRQEEDLLIDLLNKWSVVYIWRANFEEMIALLVSHEEMAESLGDKRKLGIFYAQLAHALAHKARLKDSYQYLMKALKLGEEIGNHEVIGYACIYLSSTCGELGLINDSIAFIERAQEISRVLESDLMPYRMAFHAAAPYFYRGDSKKVKRIGNRFLEMGKNKSDVRFSSLGNFWLGQGHLAAGDFLLATKYFNLAIEISTDPLISLISRFMSGFSYLSTGQLQEAENSLNELMKLSEKFDAWNFRSTSKGLLGVVLISKGNISQGIRLIEDVKRVYLENGAKYRYATVEYLLGNIYLQMVQGGGRRSLFFLAKNIGFLIKTLPFVGKKCEGYFNKAIEVAKEIGAEGVLAQSYLGMGLLYKTNGRKEDAREFLTKAIQVFEKYEAAGYLKRAKEALGSLEGIK